MNVTELRTKDKYRIDLLNDETLYLDKNPTEIEEFFDALERVEAQAPFLLDSGFTVEELRYELSQHEDIPSFG